MFNLQRKTCTTKCNMQYIDGMLMTWKSNVPYSCYTVYVLKSLFKNINGVAQSVNCLTLAQVTSSQFVSLSPVLSSVLTAQSVEPVSDSVSSPLSAPPPLMLCFFLSKINIKKSFKKILFLSNSANPMWGLNVQL